MYDNATGLVTTIYRGPSGANIVTGLEVLKSPYEPLKIVKISLVINGKALTFDVNATWTLRSDGSYYIDVISPKFTAPTIGSSDYVSIFGSNFPLVDIIVKIKDPQTGQEVPSPDAKVVSSAEIRFKIPAMVRRQRSLLFVAGKAYSLVLAPAPGPGNAFAPFELGNSIAQLQTAAISRVGLLVATLILALLL
eukprot:tig00020944_g16372.t1